MAPKKAMKTTGTKTTKAELKAKAMVAMLKATAKAKAQAKAKAKAQAKAKAKAKAQAKAKAKAKATATAKAKAKAKAKFQAPAPGTISELPQVSQVNPESPPGYNLLLRCSGCSSSAIFAWKLYHRSRCVVCSQPWLQSLHDGGLHWRW